MLHKILVAIDNDTISQRVFAAALDLAILSGASLMLVHVLPPEVEDIPVSPGFSSPTHTPLDLNSLDKYPSLRNDILMTQRKQWSNYDSGCLEQLRSYMAKAHSVGVSAEFTQSPGSPSQVICDFARTWAADLIIIGNRGRSGFNELLLGSVSNAVVHHAPCSVMVVRPQIETNPQVTQPAALEHTARE